jgi:hypothetical protein
MYRIVLKINFILTFMTDLQLSYSNTKTISQLI